MNEDRATGIAHELSNEVQVAEDRASQLQAEVQQYRDRAFRAERWLLEVYKEIENKFFNQNSAGNSGQAAPRDMSAWAGLAREDVEELAANY